MDFDVAQKYVFALRANNSVCDQQDHSSTV